ncbi:MAG TPA: PspC domain-containing protein [Anaerolineaceae bacterium]|nr:PspC domain-containing protein [Anaerolineaceae bacterium]
MEKRKLMRSATERMIAGVCGGLAEFFDLDVTLIRLIFILLFIFGGHGLLLYIVLLILMPPAPVAIPAPHITDRE